LIAPALWSCGGLGANTPTNNTLGAMQVFSPDKQFFQFYKDLGGQDFLGPFISRAFTHTDGKIYQYTTKVLMVYDPNASTYSRVSLYDLGSTLDVYEPPQYLTGGYNYNGYLIWEEVLPIYTLLGREVVGEPLTDIKYNPVLGRYEQYFTKMGFYRLENDPTKTVRLLDYGLHTCADACKYNGLLEENIIASVPPEAPVDTNLVAYEPIFAEGAARLGIGLTGKALTSAYWSVDRQIEKIYENLILVIDPSNPGRPYIRSIRNTLNVPADPQVQSAHDKVFVDTDGDGVGYNVSGYFWNYIQNHGGLEQSGYPFTTERQISARVTRQCFENYCLEFHKSAPASLDVRLQPLGYIYKDLYFYEIKPTPIPPADTASLAKISIWEEYGLLAKDQMQIVRAMVFDNNVPVEGVRLKLTLTLPSGIQQVYLMEATNADGQSGASLPQISGPEGTIVTYQVCVDNIALNICEQDNFVLWNAP